MTSRTQPWPWLLVALAAATGCPDGPLSNVFPSMVVDPLEVERAQVPVADNTSIAIEVSNPSGVRLFIHDISLSEDSDPAFSVTAVPTSATDGSGTAYPSVGPGASANILVSVRPRVVSTIEATLIITGEDDAVVPNQDGPVVEVPLIIHAEDLGLPDIAVDPEAVEFDRIGQGDVVKQQIQIRNDGVRDLVIDETTYIPDTDGDTTIKVTLPVQPGWIIAPGDAISTEVAFAPFDTDDHSGVLRILSTDPDESPLDIPVHGAGSLCPVAVAELIDDPEDIEPLDTVRLDGRNSFAVTPDTELVAWEWVLEQRPVGSTAVLTTPANDRTELTCDIAGDYQARLVVTDSSGVRSCDDAVVRLTAQPTEDLHIQLVWDHPTADLDLHLLREGGEPFTHEGDTYFSNRNPEWFVDFPESNPSLDVDDDSGYGPENINIVTPAPLTKWTVLVHYWNKNTDGDPFTVATLRVYARGIQVLDLTQSLEEDETMWQAVEIVWPEQEDQMPTMTQIGVVENFPRPF